MNAKNLIILVVVLGIAYFVYTRYFSAKQGYANINDLTGAGSLDNYEAADSGELNQNEDRPLEEYADMVDGSSHSKYARVASEPKESIMDNLQREFDAVALPKTARNITPYNVDVANPQSWSFLANAPRVQLKNRLWQDADPIRGDIPIRFNPNIALVGKSQYDRDSQRMDGFFSDATKTAYESFTGRAYKNMPVMASLGGTISDYTSI